MPRIAVGVFYIIFAALGIVLHAIEIVACLRICSDYAGFYPTVHHSAADVLLLFQYGIWGGFVVLFASEITLPEHRVYVNIFTNFSWWSSCYLSVVVTFTRLLSTVKPVVFRRITSIHTQAMCFVAWIIGLLQSYLVTLFPWYVPLYYDKDGFGFTGDWEAYATNGTRTYFYIFNGLTIFANFFMYMVIVIQLGKMAHKSQTISSKFAEDRSTSPTGRGGANLFMKRMNSIESFRHSVEFALLLACFISWLGIILEQLFINWLYFEGELRNFLIVLLFLIQSWMNTLMRIFLSRLLRHKMRNILTVSCRFICRCKTSTQNVSTDNC